MSTFLAMSGTFAAMRGLLGSKKWIMRDGRSGISSGGFGAPRQRGFAKSRGLRMLGVSGSGRLLRGGELAAPTRTLPLLPASGRQGAPRRIARPKPGWASRPAGAVGSDA